MVRCARRLTAGLVLATLLASSPASAGEPVGLPAPSDDAIAIGVSDPWTFYYAHHKSAKTNGAAMCGRQFMLALASFAGDTSADYRMFKQFRFNLRGDSCICAPGGYAAQHERAFTGAALLIRLQPRLWNQLTAAEQHKTDLLMKAALVASAFTTSDAGNSSGQNPELNGGTGLGRGWNPNFQEGMIGMMLVGTIYLGGGDAAYEFLDNYDHDAFVAQLAAAELTNTHTTFTWKEANPYSAAPTGERIEQDIKNYRYFGHTLYDLMEIFHKISINTYGKRVTTGLFGGDGYRGGGKMVSGQADLPNIGAEGMLLELDGMDGAGYRSSISYAYYGFRPNLMNHICMLVSGYWEPGPRADEIVARMNVGAPDLFYKLEHGYIDYSNGYKGGTIYITDPNWDYHMVRSLWEDVVKPYHDGALTVASAGDDQTAYDADLDDVETVTLDGAASFAAAGRALASYQWTVNGQPAGDQPVVSAALPLGRHTATLTVTDTQGGVSRDTCWINVERPALVPVCGDDISVADADGNGCEVVILDGSASQSRDGSITRYAWHLDGRFIGAGETLPVQVRVGTYEVRLDLLDSAGNTASKTITVTVAAMAEPEVTGDLDGDGAVTLADFVILKNNFGATGATAAEGDLDGDGAVNLNDFVILKNHFGS